MKKILSLILIVFLTACSSSSTQVTATVTVTSPPAATVSALPTLHPEFIAIQSQIDASGERFTLHADGQIYDGETPIPGVTVAPDGTMTITVDGEEITLDPADVDFDDKKGITIEGYELQDTDDDGEMDAWVVSSIELPMKEIAPCGSMYDVLTPTNELNPAHLLEQGDIQKVSNWVQTQLTADMFDSAKIKPFSQVGMDRSGDYLITERDTAPNYEDNSTTPFLKDNEWCASSLIDGKPYLIVYIPYYIDGLDPQDWPVMVGRYPLPEGLAGTWIRGIEFYTERMNIVPWDLSERSVKVAIGYLDPLTGQNFTEERVRQIFFEMEEGNFENTHGLTLEFLIGDNSDGLLR